MCPLPSPRPRHLDRSRGCQRQERLSIEQFSRLQSNILAETHRHGATCASTGLLHVAAQRYVAPRDHPILHAESSNPRTRAAPPMVKIAPPKKRDAYRVAQMFQPFAKALRVDRECPAAWLNLEPAAGPGLLY